MESWKIFSVLLFSFLLLGCISDGENLLSPTPSATPSPQSSYSMQSFSSWDEVSSFVGSSQSSGYYRSGLLGGMMVEATSAKSSDSIAPSANAVPDYSTTNVQVEGVDEADIVKTNGKNIFVVTNGKVVILDAYPADKMRVLSELTLDNSQISDIFIEGNKLVVFGTADEQIHPLEQTIRCAYGMCPRYYSSSFLKVFDVSDASSPKEVKTVSMKGGYYVTSRMIGGKVYALFSEPAYRDYPMPLYAVDGMERAIAPSDVKYFDYPDYNYAFNIFVSLDLNDLNKEEKREIILMGSSQNVFVSQQNAFVTYSRYNSFMIPWSVYDGVVKPYLSGDTLKKISAIDASDVSSWRKDRLKIAAATEFLDGLSSDERTAIYDKLNTALENIRQNQYSETTVVHKISLDGFKLMAEGEVPGTVLNQFSMDEKDGYLRIATTTGQTFGWRRMSPISATSSVQQPDVSKNHVFVLDGNLDVVGRLQDLAPGEKIYSVRFLGDRGYLVTFRKIDPLFVIDLSNPASPQVLGQLKIPGYSDYLHPYDETHLIGLGKETVAAEEGDFAWYQGVKLSLFDVSDVSAPKEIAKYEIGDRGTDSAALNDHKAFLFSKTKNLLVIPILLAEINEAKYPQGVEANAYGDYVFQGAYVFNVGLDGFTLKGRISHTTGDALAKSGYYYYGSGDSVKRSLYIGESLYTISDAFVKANSLGDLSEQGSVKIGTVDNQPDYGVPMPV